MPSVTKRLWLLLAWACSPAVAAPELPKNVEVLEPGKTPPASSSQAKESVGMFSPKMGFFSVRAPPGVFDPEPVEDDMTVGEHFVRLMSTDGFVLLRVVPQVHDLVSLTMAIVEPNTPVRHILAFGVPAEEQRYEEPTCLAPRPGVTQCVLVTVRFWFVKDDHAYEFGYGFQKDRPEREAQFRQVINGVTFTTVDTSTDD
jgi:hypothetical protein